MSETELSKAVNDACEKFGGIVIRVQSGIFKVRGGYAHAAPKGTPDRLVLLPHGRSVWLEVKDPNGTTNAEQRENQALWRARAVRLGHLVFEVQSVADAVRACQEAMK